MESLANPAMSALSDRAFQATFLVYVVALVFSLFYYTQAQGVIATRRRKAAADKTPATAGIGVSAGAEATSTAIADAGGHAVTSAATPARGDAGPGRGGAGEAPLEKQQRRARQWGGATQALVWLGIILHVVATVTRGLAVGRIPLGNMYEYMLVITAVAMIVAAVVIQAKASKAVWPWLLTPLLVLMFFAGTKLYVDAGPVIPPLQSYWRPVHVFSVSIGASLGMISGIFSLIFLLRVRQPAGKEHGFFGALARPLPSADTLDEIAYRLAVFTLPIFGLGIILGAIWAEAAWGRFWNWDPKETFSFITWILYAAYLHARATAGWKVGAAWINIVALGTMVFNLFFVNLVVSGLHSYAGLN